MIITSATLQTLSVGFRTQYLDAYQGGAPRVQSFSMRTTSRSKKEFYGWLGTVPGMKKFLGEAQIKNLVDHNFGIENVEFESTVGVQRIDILRDQFGMYNMAFPAMGLAARQHPDELLADAMVGGFTTLCYTGKNFFDTGHTPQAGKTTFDNKGVKKLSAANFVIARTNLKSRRNAENRPMNLGADLVLVVAPKWEDTARLILIADTVPSTAGTASQSNINKGTARLEVWPQLSSNEDAWYLLENGYPVKPFIYQVEIDTEFQQLTDLSAEHVLLFKQFLYQAYGSYAVAAAMPELAYGSTGADPA